jgi:hypothetical protein
MGTVNAFFYREIPSSHSLHTSGLAFNTPPWCHMSYYGGNSKQHGKCSHCWIDVTQLPRRNNALDIAARWCETAEIASWLRAIPPNDFTDLLIVPRHPMGLPVVNGWMLRDFLKNSVCHGVWFCDCILLKTTWENRSYWSVILTLPSIQHQVKYKI